MELHTHSVGRSIQKKCMLDRLAMVSLPTSKRSYSIKSKERELGLYISKMLKLFHKDTVTAWRLSLAPVFLYYSQVLRRRLSTHIADLDRYSCFSVVQFWHMNNMHLFELSLLDWRRCRMRNFWGATMHLPLYWWGIPKWSSMVLLLEMVKQLLELFMSYLNMLKENLVPSSKTQWDTPNLRPCDYNDDDLLFSTIEEI